GLSWIPRCTALTPDIVARVRIAPILALATLTVSLSAVVLADEPSKAEKQALAKIAKERADLAKWCSEHGLASTPRECAELERRLQASAKRIASEWDALAGAVPA